MHIGHGIAVFSMWVLENCDTCGTFVFFVPVPRDPKIESSVSESIPFRVFSMFFLILLCRGFL